MNCNTIDCHNQSRQFDLRLEKHWVTCCGYFRIATTLIGMTITDCWLAYKFHLGKRHPHKNITVVEFASILGKDCLNNDYSSLKPSDMMLTIGVSPTRACSISSFTDDFSTPARKRKKIEATTTTPASSVATPSVSSTTKTTESIHKVFREHMVQQTPKDEDYFENGKHGTRRKRGRCRARGSKTTWYCPVCVPKAAKRAWYCNSISCTRKHKRDVQRDKCIVVPGPGQWLKQTSGSDWMN